MSITDSEKKACGGVSYPADSCFDVTNRSISSLKPYPRNARTHSQKQIQQLAASIREFGFTVPVLIDADGMILAGHARIEAAKLLDLKQVPTIQIDHLSEAQKRAYILADNRLAELAGWDNELLAVELQFLSEIDVEFDVEITGFETADIDIIVQGAEAETDDQADEIPKLEEGQAPISRLGDLWLLGPHRLLCGNALESESYQRLLKGQLAQMVFTDPPYNVPIDGHVCGSGKIKHPEFAMASGEMSEDQFTNFLETVFGHLADHSIDGSIHYVFMDWRHAYELQNAGRGVYSELKNLCVWNKTNAGMGSFYRSQHELVFAFKNGTAQHINNFGLGERGRYRANVWTYPGINTFKPGRLDELAMHPTVKPVALVADAIRDCSKRGGIVLDAFAGSGTTIMAAERTARHGYAMELDPHYVDVAIQRGQEFTGNDAIHAETGQTFAEMRKNRLEPSIDFQPTSNTEGEEAGDGQ